MVTHNPELAEQYSTRIIRCVDGRVIGDSNPFEPEQSDYFAEQRKAEEEKKKGKKCVGCPYASQCSGHCNCK
jgi:putative ABC transport system permease protein